MRTMVLGGAVLAFVAGGCTDSDVARDVDTASQVASSRSMPQREAVRLGYAFIAMGTNQESISEGQQVFASGKRVEWTLR